MTPDEVTYFLSDKSNQGPLEAHFRRQCACGGASDKATLEQYAQNEKKILVAKSEIIRVMRGNRKARQEDEKQSHIHDTTPLPKRKKRKL